MAEPFVREAGSGPGVVCLHSNASTSGQWRELMDLLAPAFHVLAPDSYGSGKSPDWPSDTVIRLDDEVDFIEPVLQQAGDPFVLAGHSYGGAVALMAALRHPQRVKALVLYEPTLFSLVDAQQPPPNDTDGIRQCCVDAVKCLEAGDGDGTARHFIDFWMGDGSWARTPDARKPAIAASTRNVRRWAHALMTEPAPLEAFRRLDMPVLYMTGRRSPLSAHGVARVLLPALPRAEHLEFDKLSHMGPITHAAVVNEAIAAFLGRVMA